MFRAVKRLTLQGASFFQRRCESRAGTKTGEVHVEEVFLDWARQIHKENPVADAHFDLAAEVYERRLSGERNVVERRYLPHFREASLNVLVSSVYVSGRDLPELGLRKALGQITALREDLEAASDQICVVTRKEELDKALWAKKIAVILSLEGLDPLGSDLMLLRTFYDLGVRGASLTWSRRNAFATGCCKAGEYREIPGGLTELGREAVSGIEALGMYLDVSHLNHEGFAEVCACAKKPFTASHSNAWSVHKSYRNLKDDQIEAIAARGGVIGLNACALLTGAGPEAAVHKAGDISPALQPPGAPGGALGPAREAAMTQLCRHAEYLVSKAGDAHVGCGFDLCRGLSEATPRIYFETEDDDILAHHGEMVKLTAMLLARGMREDTVVGLIGGNFLRFFRERLG